jgi:hypothetical protein
MTKIKVDDFFKDAPDENNNYYDDSSDFTRAWACEETLKNVVDTVKSVMFSTHQQGGTLFGETQKFYIDDNNKLVFTKHNEDLREFRNLPQNTTVELHTNLETDTYYPRYTKLSADYLSYDMMRDTYLMLNHYDKKVSLKDHIESKTKELGFEFKISKITPKERGEIVHSKKSSLDKVISNTKETLFKPRGIF